MEKKERQQKKNSLRGFTMESSSSALRLRQCSAVNSYCSTHVWHPTRDLQHVENIGFAITAARFQTKEKLMHKITFNYSQYKNRTLSEGCTCCL